MCINYLDPKMDFIFKKIFGNMEDKSILLSFLNAALNQQEKIVDVDLRNVEIIGESSSDKDSRLDVLATTKDGTIINIEVQLQNQYNMSKRTLFYWSKLYSDQLKTGENYRMLKKTICINILNFIHFKDIDKYHSIFKIKEDKDGVLLEEDLEIHFLELPKLLDYSEMDPLSGWGMFLKEPASDVLEDAEESIQEIKKAKQYLFRISSDDIERERYRVREKEILDRVSAEVEAEIRGEIRGEVKGEIKGEIKAKEEVVKNMFKKGFSVEDIVDLTGLEEKRVEEIQLELNK